MDLDEEYSSDSNDDDYVPNEGEVVSEEEESGEDEAQLFGLKDGASPQKKTKKKIKREGKNDPSTRKRKGGIRLEDEEKEGEESAKPAGDEDDSTYNEKLVEAIHVEKEEKKEEVEKKKADSLWADFMKDVGGPKPKPKPAASGLGALTQSISKSSTTKTDKSEPKDKDVPTVQSAGKPSKVTITQEYDFAGEVVKVTKEVDANSKEAKAEASKEDDKEELKAGPSIPGLKRPGGGLGSVLGKINKKQKISTLEKSKLDWNSFKRKESIDEELKTHNRGKDGYIERMAFLERTDHRQFEIEKSLRLSNSKR